MNTNQKQRNVSGIGGVFFRSKDPDKLANWYQTHFDISPAPTSYEQEPWRQDAGYTVFAPFEQSTDYFGATDKQWMINFRVNDLDRIMQNLRESKIDVKESEPHPSGRFARLTDPEGNPIELWQPNEELEP